MFDSSVFCQCLELDGGDRVASSVMKTDCYGDPLIPGASYLMASGPNTVLVEITSDGEHIRVVPSFFAGLFRMNPERIRLSDLAGHCEFLLHTPLGEG